MDELFAPPGESWQRVSPKLRVVRCLLAVVPAALVLVGACVLLLTSLPDPLLLAVAGLAVLAAAVACPLLVRNARSWGYAERADDLYVTSGVMFRRLVAVPYGRMQYVDVSAGPVSRAFGLADVHLHTANPATSARIPGLLPAEAARLRDRLTERGESTAAGL